MVERRIASERASPDGGERLAGALENLAKGGAIQGMLHDAKACGCKLVGELIAVADAHHFLTRIVAKDIGRKANGHAKGFEVTRRHGDDQVAPHAMRHVLKP